MVMKKIAALTMVRNDDFFLERWVAYYGAQLGRENIYVFLDGTDQIIPDFCEGVKVTVLEHHEENVRQGDRHRASFLSAKAAELFSRYDVVIGTDVDEFLVVEPLMQMSLKEMLSRNYGTWHSISGLGVDVGQKMGEELPIKSGVPLLRQRKYAKLSTRYSKANTLLRPAEWGSGFHRIKNKNFHIVAGLYLFHFGCVDLDRIKSKMNSDELTAAGWSKHLKKRARTIELVSRKKAQDWEECTSWARRTQNIVRPIYAWNKPAMFEANIVVEIPERFSDIV
ncbi:MAG: glycosyltransferase family 2 protein [Bacteroidales bacterium]|nr:glycosyltransferase family 2 protein [Bacteroidales bacterium]